MAAVGAAVSAALSPLLTLPVETLVAERYAKFAAMGR
jgi:acetyl-CoA carboxylase alpha subunit